MATVQRFCCAIACAAAILLSGCGTIEQAQQTIRGVFRPPSVVTANPGVKRANQITQEELEQFTYGFADRYLAYIITATDNIERDIANTVQRRRAHQVRLV